MPRKVPAPSCSCACDHRAARCAAGGHGCRARTRAVAPRCASRVSNLEAAIAVLVVCSRLAPNARRALVAATIARCTRSRARARGARLSPAANRRQLELERQRCSWRSHGGGWILFFSFISPRQHGEEEELAPTRLPLFLSPSPSLILPLPLPLPPCSPSLPTLSAQQRGASGIAQEQVVARARHAEVGGSARSRVDPRPAAR